MARGIGRPPPVYLTLNKLSYLILSKKVREKASRKRHQKEQLSSDRGKKARIVLGADNQPFRGKKKSLELLARTFAPTPLKSEQLRPWTEV